MAKKKKLKKSNKAELWTEDQYEEYIASIFGMDFIAGFTDSGVPFGIFNDYDEVDQDDQCDISDDLPF